MPQEQPGYNAAIAVNQVGYRPESHKYAVAKDVGGTCQLINANPAKRYIAPKPNRCMTIPTISTSISLTFPQ